MDRWGDSDDDDMEMERISGYYGDSRRRMRIYDELRRRRERDLRMYGYWRGIKFGGDSFVGV